MQQGSSPQSGMPGTPPVWRSAGPQPSYPTPGAMPPSPQRGASPGYGMPPGHHHPQATGQSQYMSTHPSSQHPSHMSQDPYRHMQPQHPHQMQYRQVSSGTCAFAVWSGTVGVWMRMLEILYKTAVKQLFAFIYSGGRYLTLWYMYLKCCRWDLAMVCTPVCLLSTCRMHSSSIWWLSSPVCLDQECLSTPAISW